MARDNVQVEGGGANMSVNGCVTSLGTGPANGTMKCNKCACVTVVK